MHRRSFLAGIAGVGTGALAGCASLGGGNASADEDEEYDVGMGAAFYRPAEFEVAVGGTVVWRNTGSRRHTVTAYDTGVPDDADYFASGGFEDEQAARDAWMDSFGGHIEAGGEYEHTFEVPGEYEYFCVPHEPQGMKGTVVVTE